MYILENLPSLLTIESRDRSSDRGQAHTRFEGGTHENHTERNETSYGIREREREISRSSRKMMVLKRERACGSYILGNEEAVGLQLSTSHINCVPYKGSTQGLHLHLDFEGAQLHS